MTCAWCVKLPEVPVTATLAEPIAAVLEAVKVRVLLEVAVLGLKTAVTPDGKPDAVRLTLPLKPFCGVMVIVVPPPLPWTTVTVLGEAERTKFCAGAVAGQLLTRLAAFTLPMPVAKSQPTDVGYAGAKVLFEVESSPTEAPPR